MRPAAGASPLIGQTILNEPKESTRTLRKYQSKAAWNLYHNKRMALYAGLGIGKTAIILHVLQKLLEEGKITKALIVAPIAVAKSVWQNEAAEWSRLHGLRFSKILGSPKQRLAAVDAEADIYLINYENLVWLINETKFKAEALVLDESTMMQGYDSVRFKGKAATRRPPIPRKNGLKHVVQDFEYVYEVSGMPKPGDYVGLWSQMYCLDQGDALEDTITKFKQKYYFQYGTLPYQIKPKPGAPEAIEAQMAPLCYRIPESVTASVLPKVVKQTHYIDLPPKARKLYKQLEDDFFTVLNDQAITVDNIAILGNKLQQVCQGAIYDDDENVIPVHDEKLQYLEAMAEDGENLLVLYTYRHDVKRLLAWREAPVLRGKVDDVIKAWNSSGTPLAYGHPRSMGHGLNLQFGGNHIVFFGLTWSLDLYYQAIGRLARSGQTKTVFVHHIVARDTIETELMLPRLAEKEQSHDRFLKSFENWRSQYDQRRRNSKSDR